MFAARFPRVLVWNEAKIIECSRRRACDARATRVRRKNYSAKMSVAFASAKLHHSIWLRGKFLESRMDWSEFIRKAEIIAEKNGHITFDELNAMIPSSSIAPEDVEAIL